MTRQRPTPADDRDTIVEGLSGRLPFLVGGIIAFLALVILLRIRSMTSSEATIDFDAIDSRVLVGLLIAILLAPLAHTLCHAIALLATGAPIRLHRTLFYPRIRPAKPLSRAAATRVLLAPLGLSLLLLGLMFIRSIGIAAAILNALNLAMTTNDIWKVLGLRRFPANAAFEINIDHCRLVENTNG